MPFTSSTTQFSQLKSSFLNKTNSCHEQVPNRDPGKIKLQRSMCHVAPGEQTRQLLALAHLARNNYPCPGVTQQEPAQRAETKNHCPFSRRGDRLQPNIGTQRPTNVAPDRGPSSGSCFCVCPPTRGCAQTLANRSPTCVHCVSPKVEKLCVGSRGWGDCLA